jgi:UDP-2,3-diacylglucosamine pyrophosphatase LpxH
MTLAQYTLTPAWPAEAGLTWAGPAGLDRILPAAPETPIDNCSKIILFSDTHRGDKSATDPFAPNEALFLYALTHYYQQGFTYIELGDGDDLWQAPHFGAIQHAYPQVFELLDRFQQDHRLRLIWGNHELAGGAGQPLPKGDFITEECLGLRYRPTGQLWLVAHGHQADPWCDPANRLSQVVYGLLQLLRAGQAGGRLAPVNQAIASHLERWYRQWDQQQQQKLTHQLAQWACRQQQALICGHTHRPFFPASPRMPYFNTGCGIHPGHITGLEIQNGRIGLVKWWTNGCGEYRRKLLEPARPLEAFA